MPKEGVKEVLEARYGEVWSRTTNPRQRDLHVLLDQDRLGLAQGAFVPERWGLRYRRTGLRLWHLGLGKN